MSNEFDVEMKEEDEPRVSNDYTIIDFNSNEEIRVSSSEEELGASKSEFDDYRVLPGNGDDSKVYSNGDLRVSISPSSNDVVSNVKAENVGIRDVENSEKGENGGMGGEELGFSGKMSSGLSEGCDDENVGSRGVGEIEDGGDGNFRSERRGDSRALVSKDVSSSDGDGDASVMRSVSKKVLGTEFEMGDMVWGKVKSHPWWPGHLYNEGFATSSVRRSKRDGHILVAFFGDSSYGWFDPMELVPYDLHYAEKSQQTTSRNFVRAVEESVDEASRRSALGLSCRCRNEHNFRPTNVPGHLAVDVFDYEPGGVYSVNQIQKARDSFSPADTLSFIRNLAAAPQGGDSQSLDFIKKKATALAYRRSKFEEFDETYAEAFGHKPERPSKSAAALTDKEPSRAPLSGPLVFAEELCGQKTAEATKVKNQSKKDRYLFKRRDEFGDARTTKISQRHASSSSSAFEYGTSDSVAGAFMIQKRDNAEAVDDEPLGSSVRDLVATSADVAIQKDSPIGLVVMSNPIVSEKRLSFGGTSALKQSESSTAVAAQTDGVPNAPNKIIKGVCSTDKGSHGGSGGLLKKRKASKRTASEETSETPDAEEKKIKKSMKKDCVSNSEHLERCSVGSSGTVAAKLEESQVSNWKKDVSGLELVTAIGENEADPRQILADLHGLALNPFHGMERNGPVIARKFFLKFRSLFFRKSSSASAAADSEPSEAWGKRPFPGADPAESALVETQNDVPSVKRKKLLARKDDPTKVGQKRIPSERQEEIAAKRAKKVTDLKSLSSERKALLTNAESQRAEGKAQVAVTQSPQVKHTKVDHHVKKGERPPKVEEPTYLVMKFQSGSSLPSLVELKARFARFGPLDTSLNRVFYTTNTCRVAFLYKQDAQIAHRYAVGSKSVFSNVRFMLKPVTAPESQQPSSGKPEDMPGEPASNRDSSAADPRTVALAVPTQLVQRLKSCLKKPSGGDESGGHNNGGGSMRSPRVRFNVEEKGSASNKGLQVQTMESRNPVLFSYEGSPSSSVAMDVINNQRFMSSHPLQPPLLPQPPQFVRAPINHQYHHVEVAQRNNFHENFTTTGLLSVSQAPPLPPPPKVDISQQMISLLTRCHDVVTNVKSILGHVPYHPL